MCSIQKDPDDLGEESKSYFCINCGHPSAHLFKIYGKDNLIKLTECEICGQLVDKFLEYDIIIVIINLILLDPSAYRHLLLNSKFKSYWKIGLLFLMTESYCFWCFHKGSEIKAQTETFYELETNFYQSLVRSIVNTMSFHFLILVIPHVKFVLLPDHKPPQFSSFALWKGLIIAGYAELFELCRLVWSYSTSGSLRIYFRHALFIVSLTQAYAVVTGTSKYEAIATILLSFLFQKYLMLNFDSYFPIIV